MRIVVRADASVTMGTGHVMRCLTLADVLRARGAACSFVTRDLPGHLGAVIAERGFAVSLLKPPTSHAPSGPPSHAGWAGVTWAQDLADTRAAISKTDWMVVDHYSFDKRWHDGMPGHVKRVMVIDDLADRSHSAALLLDQNLGRDAREYDSLVPTNCRRLIGPQYALLRPEFAVLRAEALKQRKKTRISHLMISMGGTDMVDATSSVLRILMHAKLPNNLRISVVMGSRAPALKHVRKLAETMPRPTTVLVDVRNMATLMADADIAIGAGGSTTWERCCVGLPSIIVETAANQSGATAAMQSVGAALGVGPLTNPNFANQLVAAVERLLDSKTNARLSQASAKICDGDGAKRVAQLIEDTPWA